MRKVLVIPAILFSMVLMAQNDVDALRYSMSSLAGTARFNSLGGAFGALGADMAGLSTNPGGIAMFQRSEFSLSVGFYVRSTESNYLGNAESDSRFNVNMPHGGVVFTAKTKNEKEFGWKNWNFGIVYNRLDNYQASSYFSGFNNANSLLDDYLENINQGTPVSPGQLDPFYEYQAYQTYLLNYDTVTGLYSSVIPDGKVLQRESKTTRGARGETLFAFGGNFNHKLYLGASLGIPTIRYNEESDYSESDDTDTIFDFKSFNLRQEFTTTGVGVNFKFGFIYRMFDWMRIGGAIHSPTYYGMHDDYYTYTNSNFDNGDSYSQASPAGAFDYNLTTPFRAIGSVAFVFGKSGLISGECEYLDYRDAELDGNGYPFFDENDAIRKKYSKAFNLRAGTEWVFSNIILRGGYALNGSPFNKNLSSGGYDLSRQSITGGLGVRDKRFFADLGYVYSRSKALQYPYVLNDEQSPVSKSQSTSHNVTLTIGVKF